MLCGRRCFFYSARCNRHYLGVVPACVLSIRRRRSFLRQVTAGAFFYFLFRCISHVLIFVATRVLVASLPQVFSFFRSRTGESTCVVSVKENIIFIIFITTIIIIRRIFRLKQSTSIRVDNPTWPFDLASLFSPPCRFSLIALLVPALSAGILTSLSTCTAI